MNYNINFNTFIDMHSLSVQEFSVIGEKFITDAKEFLVSINVDSAIAESVGKCLFNSMFTNKTYYHTPFHVLSMLYFAEMRKSEFKLENYEKLAIFFHDAIYRPGAKDNEKKSAMFMNSLLSYKDFAPLDNILWKATFIIETTAKHLEDNEFLPNYVFNIMDLDLMGFCSSPENFKIQNALIMKEFCQPDVPGYGCSLKEYYEGRLKFMKALNARKTIYRTKYFQDTFEALARHNIKNEIIELEKNAN